MGKNGKVIIQSVPISKIKLARNSRLNVTDEEIAGLMQSIKQVGLLQPIGLVKNGGGYEICYGNRRFMALSKLGVTKVPAVIHETKTQSEADLKNLTENLQRRNLSLTESGRYMQILHREGLSYAEIAVRLGLSRSYVNACLNAYENVPKEFRNDLAAKVDNDRSKTPGKISITTAQAIINAQKAQGLSAPQARLLYQEAKSNDKFAAEDVKHYAAAIRSGTTKNFVDAVDKSFNIQYRFTISNSHKEELEKKFVHDGPFRSLNGLFLAILKGEKAVKIKVLDR